MGAVVEELFAGDLVVAVDGIDANFLKGECAGRWLWA
jgi:hypothetical protein